MKRLDLPLSRSHLAIAALLMGWLTASAIAQNPNQGIAEPAQGQGPPPVRVGGVVITGIPEDWSHRYVVFSNPGTEQGATQSGQHAQWQKIVNEPRYVMQQMRRNAPVYGPATPDVEARSRWISEPTGPRNPLKTPKESGSLEGMWSQSLGGPGLRAGHYPAKYSLSVTTDPTCRDFVIFPTGAPGSGGALNTPAAGQATIIAFNNLYVGGCSDSAPNPNVYWAYNTGGTATLSPVLSLDGKQVAFVQSSAGAGTTASLVILKMATSGGAYNNPVIPTNYDGNPAGYRGCIAPCDITFSLGASDTNSAQFYRYDGSDTLYVGDDNGGMHQFTGVFDPNGNGTPPGEVTPAPWYQITGAQNLTSPVYDSASTLLFVSVGAGTNIGDLESVTTTGTEIISVSNRLDCGANGLQDPPILDSSSGNVYVFVGYGCDVSGGLSLGNSYINRFAASLAAPVAGYGNNAVNFGNAGTNANGATGRIGAFDNLYLSSSPGTNAGNVYSCVNGQMFQISMSVLNGSTPGSPSAGPIGIVNTADVGNGMTSCSPVTEFLGGDGVDRLFVSVYAFARGSLGLCNGGACVYNFDVTAGTLTTPTNGLQLATGNGTTSGFIVDSRSTALVGAQQIYFTFTGDNTLNFNNTAIQASQSNLR